VLEDKWKYSFFCFKGGTSSTHLFDSFKRYTLSICTTMLVLILHKLAKENGCKLNVVTVVGVVYSGGGKDALESSGIHQLIMQDSQL
jgi:hypothetical protein